MLRSVPPPTESSCLLFSLSTQLVGFTLPEDLNAVIFYMHSYQPRTTPFPHPPAITVPERRETRSKERRRSQDRAAGQPSMWRSYIDFTVAKWQEWKTIKSFPNFDIKFTNLSVYKKTKKKHFLFFLFFWVQRPMRICRWNLNSCSLPKNTSKIPCKMTVRFVVCAPAFSSLLECLHLIIWKILNDMVTELSSQAATSKASCLFFH